MTILLLLLMSWPLARGQAPEELIANGRQLFNTYCQSCHGIHEERLGPMLASVTRKKSDMWLKSFIRNSQEMILEEDSYAAFLFGQYNHVVMPSFKQLSDQQLENILRYIAAESKVISKRPDLPESVPAHVLEGKELYNRHCTECHFIGADHYGPSLGSVTKRRPWPWLLAFVRNSTEVIRSGDAYAVALDHSYKDHVMPNHEFLSENEIRRIMDYIEFVSESPVRVAGVNGRPLAERPQKVRIYPAQDQENDEGSLTENKIFLVILTGIGAVIHVWVIIRLYRYLSG